jgi:hypothetical protein
MLPYAASPALVRRPSPAPTRQAKCQALEHPLYLLRFRLFLLCSRRFQPSTGNVSQKTGTVSSCNREYSSVRFKLTSRSPTKTSSRVLQKFTDQTPPRDPATTDVFRSPSLERYHGVHLAATAMSTPPPPARMGLRPLLLSNNPSSSIVFSTTLTAVNTPRRLVDAAATTSTRTPDDPFTGGQSPLLFANGGKYEVLARGRSSSAQGS